MKISFKKLILLFMLFVTWDILINSFPFFLSLEIFFYWDSLFQLKQILILLNYVLQILITILLLTSKNKILRVTTYLFLLVTFSIYMTYYYINGYGFTATEANIAISDFGFVKEAFNNFSQSIGFASVTVLTILSVIYAISRNVKHNINPRVLILFFSALMIFYITMGTVTATGRLFFLPYKVTFLFYNALKTPLYTGKKEDVKIKSTKHLVNKIIYVVDESVTGNKLSLNGWDTNTTPFLLSVKDKIINYGIASSGANCSGYSNTILRSGINWKSIPDKNQQALKGANIWAYAKKMGYYTVYIDAQNHSSKPQNYMNKYDFKTIDKYIHFDELANGIQYLYDSKIIDALEFEVKEHPMIFVYINKLGSHFPYEAMYPQEKKVFSPTLKLSESPSLSKKTETLNSYYNTLRWGVDDWWNNIFDRFHKKNILFIYTSDHGQNIFNNNKKQTHCSKEPLPIEANVPLFLVPFGETETILTRLSAKNIKNNLNKTSHFNIFPTILSLMGYPLDINNTLFDDLNKQKRVFYSGDIWARVHLDENVFDYNSTLPTHVK